MTKAARLLAGLVTAALVLVAWFMPPGHAQQAARPGADTYRQLPWRYIGPEGNRFSAAAGIAGNPHTYYVGAASGGIYKTTDGGTHLGARLRRPAGGIHRRARRRDVGPQRRLGRHRRGQDPQPHLAGAGHLQVHRRAARHGRLMGLEQTGRIPASRHRPEEPGRRAGLRAWPRVRPAAGARGLPHGGWREDVDEDPLRRREHRLLRHRHGPQQPAHPLRGDVAARDSHLGQDERRTRRRPLRLA